MGRWTTTLRSSRVVVVGAGGGGDVVSAYVFCKVLEDVVGTRECLPAGVLWERWVVDPYPGPVPRASLRNARLDKCVWVGKDTYVVRGEYAFRPHTAYVAEVLGTEIPAVTLEHGVEGVYRCFSELSDGALLIDLDVGGDILAEGWEEDLWSPLADAITLAATERTGGLVGIAAPGADGELPQEVVLQRIGEVLRAGGYVGALGLWDHHRSLYEAIIDRVKTEASKAPFLALKGDVGAKPIRGGSRVMNVNVATLMTFLLRSEEVIKLNKLAQGIRYTRSLAETWAEARRLGIPTELDLEVMVTKKYGVGPGTTPEWNALRAAGRAQRLKTSLDSMKNGGTE
ncbi:MAG: DUF1152 domain-containing protein [Zestosphaera sp.]